jgi:hypothetical protein
MIVMKILMDVIDCKQLDGYIDEEVVPFAVCASVNSTISKRQLRFLEKYYDRIVDKRGWVSFYCNVINAWKCREMNYKSIEFSDGEEKRIGAFNLEPSESLGGKYVVVPYFATGENIDSISLVKMVRLKVAEMNNHINDMIVKKAG